MEAVKIYRCRRGIPNFKPKITAEYFWKPDEIKLLGLFTNAEVGRRLRCSKVMVRNKRGQLGVPAWRPMPECKPWTSVEEKLLGSVPDQALAAQLGRTKNAVTLRQLKFRIPPFKSETA